MVKMLQGSVVTQTMLGGLTIHPQSGCKISYSVHVPVMKKLLQK